MSKTILLADDSVTIQKVIELTFMDEDYEVVSAGNGDEALDRLESVSPDVVIADVHMPGASGFDVAKRSKQLHPGVPVLLLVGTFEPFDQADFDASGAESYLKKPFDSQELLQRVDDLLEGAEGVPETTQPAGAGEPSAGGDVLSAIDEDEAPAGAPEAGPAAEPGWGGGEAEEAPEDLASTQAVAGFGPATESVRPTPPAVQPEAPSAEEGDDEPFPELAGAGGGEDGGDVFGDLDEGDGSTEVLPPPDLGDEPEEEAPPAPGAEDEGPVAFDLGPIQEAPGTPTSTEVPPPPDATPLSELGGEPEAPGGEEATAAVLASPAAGGEEEDEGAAEPEGAASGVAAPAGAPAATGRDGGLSDEDVDRIARRVVELLGDDVLREVAWDVVPDLAEVVIRDRLHELESQVD